MSPRNKTLRKVLNPPVIKGLKPFGSEIGRRSQDPVVLLFEEYEAIRLSDYDGFNHLKGSSMMGVSRPTFTRIYASALKKIAKALVEGRMISIMGGKVYFDSDWYHCKSCNCYFNNPDKDQKITSCPLCGGIELARYDYDCAGEESQEPEIDLCFCPRCGYEQAHSPGIPCRNLICPGCQGTLKAKFGF